MREATTYVAADGKKFDDEDACRAHEVDTGWAGPIAEYLETVEPKSRTGQAMRRNAIADYVRWEKDGERLRAAAAADAA